MVKPTLALKVVGSIVAAVLVAGGGIALAAQSGSFSASPRATSSAHDGQSHPSEGCDAAQQTAEPDLQPSRTPRATGMDEDSDERGVRPTASSTANSQQREAGDADENEQGEQCDQEGEQSETASPQASDDSHDGGSDTDGAPGALTRDTLEPTTSHNHD
jgi:hypothetical protein